MEGIFDIVTQPGERRVVVMSEDVVAPDSKVVTRCLLESLYKNAVPDVDFDSEGEADDQLQENAEIKEENWRRYS